MKRIGIVCTVIIVFLSLSAQAQEEKPAGTSDYKWGLGVRFSTKPAIVNNSISFKYFFTEKTAGEALFSVAKPFALGLLVEQHQPLAGTPFKYFYGGGVYSSFGSVKEAGLQGVVGLDYKVPNIPFNLSLDWKPELTFAKDFGFEPAALGLSARFTIQ